MASSSRLTLISPLRVWLIFNLLFVALVASSWYSSYRLAAADNERLVANQVLTLTKSRFEDIKNRRFRPFVEGVGREFSDLYVRLRIADETYEFGKRPVPGHCGDLAYPLGGVRGTSEALITMCRPFRFSTVPMLTVLVVYLLISGLSLAFVRRLERRTTATLVEFLRDSGVEIDSGRDLIGIMADMRDIRLRLDQAQSQERQLIDTRARAELAEQVAHDIRSPLSALEATAGDMASLPENKRAQIRGALVRIRDIANGLLDRHRAAKGATAGDAKDYSPQMLSSLIESIVSEKRMALDPGSNIEIQSPTGAASYGHFGRVQPVEFNRVLSNLINNAVEASGDAGSVRVGISAADGEIRVTVADAGKGISRDVLAKLGERGASYGKAGGSGLGLHHARTCAEAWGGRLDIASEIGKGTVVTFVLPSAPPPDWFVPEIELPAKGPVVILDDDQGIHLAWRDRLAAAGAGSRAVEIHDFRTPQDIRAWKKGNDDGDSDALYLLDYDLAGFSETGLSLAVELGIERRSILVTGHENEQVLTKCRERGIRMLPKNLASLVPIRTGRHVSAATGLLDAVLIDDDPLTRMTWENAASDLGKRLQTFPSPAAFLRESDGIDRRTPIYFDVKLADGTNGAEESLKVHGLGFTEIYLVTGHSPENFADYRHLRAVVGKEPPWNA